MIKQTLTQVRAEIKKNGTWEGWLCPSKCYPSPSHPFNVSILTKIESLDELKEKVNSFSYYNCNYEVGYNVHYYKV